MRLNKDFITKENSKKLLDSILLSLKSSENTRLLNNSEKKSENNSRMFQCIETNVINTKNTDRKLISSFSISINRYEVPRWFKPCQYRYELEFTSDHHKYETLVDTNQYIIVKIYDFLIDLERNKKIEETNQTLEKIIGDISTTIEKKYRRDETINQILN